MTWKDIGIGLLIFALVPLAAFGPARSAWAQADTVTVNIPPQDLSSALKAFADQTNLQVLYASDLAGGLTTKGAVGTVTPQEAIRQLLEGTGLQYTFTDAKTVTLQTAAPLSPTSHTEPLGSAEPPTAKQKPVKIPEVVVKDVRERDYTVENDSIKALKEIPGTVNVVTREEIQRAHPKSADEMLRRIPGVNIIEEHGQGLRPNISIRGMDPVRSRNVLIL
ncbi:MAG: TonB-dependent receptor plug domain-containing protein, partial [Pseudomonadota bacterium]